MKSAKDLEDELLDLFEDDTAYQKSTIVDSATKKLSENIISGSFNDVKDDDFLSWLEDTSEKDIKPKEIEQIVPANSSTEQVSDYKSMDLFFDEVFGDPTETTHLPTVDLIQNINDIQLSMKRNEIKVYEEEIKEILNSSFPDIGHLKKIIDNSGFIPNILRGEIWTLILSGNCLEDDEVKDFELSNSNFSTEAKLIEDCKTIIGNLESKLSKNNQQQILKDMVDIVALFCLRRNIEYNNSISLYTKLLSPLVLNDISVEVSTNNNNNNSDNYANNNDNDNPQVATISKTLASSCFHALITNFVPLITLKVI
jgi:hypothetical protein